MNIENVFDLTGKVALITGGGSGIGKGCAIVLAQAGASVVIAGRRESKLREVQKEIQDMGNTCEVFPADVTDESACKAMVEYCIQVFGRLDILINSAGSRGSHGSLETEFATENLNDTMAVDFNGTVLPIKYAYPYCAKGGCGSIINIASLAALRGSGPIMYSAAKGAIKSLTKVLAKRFGDQKIRVNTIYPGLIITEMNQDLLNRPEALQHFRDESPLGMIGDIYDIAYCALYLSSEASKFVTGQDFVIDGGAMC